MRAELVVGKPLLRIGVFQPIKDKSIDNLSIHKELEQGPSIAYIVMMLCSVLYSLIGTGKGSPFSVSFSSIQTPDSSGMPFLRWWVRFDNVFAGLNDW